MSKHSLRMETDLIIDELLNYIERNPVLNFINNLGHSACAKALGKKGGLLLDLGCGRGGHFSYFEDPASVVALDYSETLLKKARDVNSKIRLIRADIKALPFRDGIFDSIVSVYVLEHLRDLKTSLSEIHRILKKGGEFISAIPTEGFFYRLGRGFTTKRYIEKRHNIDYLSLVRGEHCNDTRYIIDTLRRFFEISKITGVPFGIPFVDFNYSLTIKATKR